MGGMSPALKRAQEKYNKETTKSVHLKFNIYTEGDLLAWLFSQPQEAGGKNGYIKRLIAEDMRRASGK